MIQSIFNPAVNHPIPSFPDPGHPPMLSQPRPGFEPAEAGTASLRQHGTMPGAGEKVLKMAPWVPGPWSNHGGF